MPAASPISQSIANGCKKSFLTELFASNDKTLFRAIWAPPTLAKPDKFENAALFLLSALRPCLQAGRVTLQNVVLGLP